MAKRIGIILLLLSGLLPVISITAQDAAGLTIDVTDYPATMQQMTDALVSSTRGSSDPSIFQAVATSADPLYIAPLVDLAYFARAAQNPVEVAIFDALQTLSGQPFGTDWTRYFEWAGASNVAVPSGYAEFKGRLYGYLDPGFTRFLRPGDESTAQINLVEVIWGGISIDGIPALVNAEQVSPEQTAIEGDTMQDFCRQGDCSYPAADEYVFGITINGDSRAYPLRILNWHELFNDAFGQTPLYDQPDGQILCQFRAPRPFKTIARQGEDWVQIVGKSAGCPVGVKGWLEVSALDWDADWESVRDLLPDTAAGGTALKVVNAVDGRVHGIPVMLAYCTLCGSGVLYDPILSDLVVNGQSQGSTTLEFASSGLLMRSDKLMYDRTTDTLWNAMTGTPASGPLAGQGLQLQQLPVVVTDWGSWLRLHPDTSVLSLFTGYQRTYAVGEAYRDYFNDPDQLMFPVWRQDTAQAKNKSQVFGLVMNDVPKAYPLEVIIPEGVTNDEIDGEKIVLISHANTRREFDEPGDAAVRAYSSGGHVFSKGEARDTVVDELGIVWNVTEEALIASDGTRLTRLPGHLAYWFSWYAFYPQTTLYRSGEAMIFPDQPEELLQSGPAL